MAKKFTKFYNTNFYVYFEMCWNSVHALSLFFGPVFNQGGFIYSSLLECYKTTHVLNGLNCNDYFEFNY